ncbi:DUF3551 domain-containing protein [Bradyrhizobium brasilense]|uniref:DUF3551 domain-containing protein n=1 Tax=Bradyrhizobium brasilense TaxID=1419277 RepID=UPI0024B224BB|nr:DUF3551 domain-containing protein [Bradyrhizobium australafricanum]WFU29135.1 DUF3551 domain-containing protein [Bradyrhizobium australafricanum]
MSDLDRRQGRIFAAKGMQMRTMILAAAASVVAFATLGTAPAYAVGVRYPFCIQGDRYPGLSNCSYPSYEACLATASGIGQKCIANPYYAGDNDPRSYLHVSPRDRREGNFFDLFIH